MLTIRSSLILAAATLTFVFSIVDWQEPRASTDMARWNEPLALLSLSTLIWIWIEWLLFQRLKVSAKPVIRNCSRTIDGQSHRYVTMVADRSFSVKVSGVLPKVARGYRIIVNDSVPDTFAVVEGTSFRVIDAGGFEEFEFEYKTSTSICGQVSFPGLRIEVSDYWGFFRSEQFIPTAQEPTVLPYLIRPQTTVSVLKHNNLQRHIGHHRHKSAGVSSELLGIRDYRIGDPPRTIAWKPTARLGKLMTREFENEVPIRATLLVDLAIYQFQGRPGASAADRAITSCAAIAKLLLADRDPVAATLMQSDKVQRIEHGSGERQLARLLQYLMAASNPNPPLEHFSIDDLVQLVFDNCSRRFPRLFDEHFNDSPVRKRIFSFTAGRLDRIRRSLAIVLEHLLELEPGVSTRLQLDDSRMRNACLAYVQKYSVVASSTNVTISPPWSDPNLWYRESRKMTLLLADILMEAKSRAKDNELFVLIAPEPFDRECEEALDKVIKTVVSAGHRLVFVAPMVPYIKPVIFDPVAKRILESTDMKSSRNAESGFKKRMGELGVAFARIDDPKLMQIVAMEVGLLQSGKSRGRVLRAR
jgi:uncharacterized protein (DUF58 family)